MPLTEPVPTIGGALPHDPYLNLVANFAGKRILVVGDVVADEYIYGETDRISREAPVLIVRWESSEVKLGGAGNAAANLRDMGAQVTMLGVVGRDERGDAVRRESERLGIRLLSPDCQGLTTETKTRILAGGRNTRRQQMLRIDRGQTAIPDEAVNGLVSLLKAEADACDAILVSDYGAGVLAPKVVTEIGRLSRGGKLVCVDSRYGLGTFRGATVLKPNESEFEAMIGYHPATEGDFQRAAMETLVRMDAQALLVTLGSNGMLLTTRECQTRIMAYGTHQTVDVCGAGDTVASSLALSLAAGASFEEAANLANVAGALKVRKMGTVTVSQSELSEEILHPD